MESIAKLVAVVGTTASGKSAAAMQIALERNGEIICADSRTVYRGMDIGTAKPTAEDQKLVPHHLLDVVNPDERFNVSDFQKLAKQAIDDIASRGKLPILVGGTGLYVDSILYDFSFRSINKQLRQELDSLTVNELQARIAEQGLELPQNAQNPRHLVRVLETGGQSDQKNALRQNTLVLGVRLPDDELKQRIARRIEQMFAQGLEQEVRGLAQTYGWDTEAMKGIGYQEFRACFEGQQSLQATQKLITQNTWQYARRQRTWFKRNPDIHWQDTIEQPSATIEG